MNDSDKFLKTDNPFEKLEFEAEMEEPKPLSEFEKSLKNEEKIEKEIFDELEFSGPIDNGLKNQNEWSTTYNDIFLEIFDSEHSFEQLCDKYTNSLLEKGIKVDPHNVYKVVEMANSRMLKMAIIKRLAHAHGLHYEWPQILEKELSLMYNSRFPEKPTEFKGRPVGES